MIKLPWTKDPEVVNVDTMEQRRQNYEEYAVYVTDEEARRTMLRGLHRVVTLLKANDPVGAKSHLEIVKHAYTMARYRNQVLKYRSTRGGSIALGQLALLCIVFAIGHGCWPTPSEETSYKLFLSVAGGGLGGIAIVILSLLGIQIQTSATIHRDVWYVLKPVSGYIMGLVTYLAVEVGTQAIGGKGQTTDAQTVTIAKPFAVFLIGFLGGFFETFANKTLLSAAKLGETPTPSATTQQPAPKGPNKP